MPQAPNQPRAAHQVIRIEKLRLRPRLGWYEAERAHPQTVIVNLSLTTSLTKAGITDDLKDTLNYEEVISLINHLCAEREWKLLEHFEHELATHLFAKFPLIEELSIRVRKSVLSEAEGISIELVCSRTNFL